MSDSSVIIVKPVTQKNGADPKQQKQAKEADKTAKNKENNNTKNKNKKAKEEKKDEVDNKVKEEEVAKVEVRHCYLICTFLECIIRVVIADRYRELREIWSDHVALSLHHHVCNLVLKSSLSLEST